jgi:hypothetical protein
VPVGERESFASNVGERAREGLQAAALAEERVLVALVTLCGERLGDLADLRVELSRNLRSG